MSVSLLLIVLVIYSVTGGSWATTTSSPAEGTSSSTSDSKYSVEFVEDLDNVPTKVIHQSSVVKMKTADGTGYVCYVPIEPTPEDKDPKSNPERDTTPRKGPDTTKMTKMMTAVQDHLNQVKGCVKRINGWWTYDLCWKGSLSQYHVNEQANNKIEASYDLGSFDPLTADVKYTHTLQGSTPRPFLSYQLKKGTECDITGQKRETEVRAYCNAAFGAQHADGFFEVVEHATCSYHALLFVSVLCEFDEFKVAPVHKETIYCVKSTKFV